MSFTAAERDRRRHVDERQRRPLEHDEAFVRAVVAIVRRSPSCLLGMITATGDAEERDHDHRLVGLVLIAAPDYRRAKITLKRAREALPNLQTEDATEWMGHRPALPDTVPVIAASAKTPGVFYATGHGHLGVTNAATTAHLIGQLMAGETPDIDLRPYRIDRF